MRVLLFVYEYPPLGGGVANAIFHLLQEWRTDADLKIDVVTSSVKNTPEEVKLAKNIRLYKVPIGVRQPKEYRQQTLWHMVRYTLGSLWLGWRLQRQSRYDVSLAFGYPGPVASWVLSWFGLPYMVALRGVDVPGYNPRFSWGKYVHQLVTWVLLSRAQAVIANSRWLADLANKTVHHQKITVIPNGVDRELFQPVPEDKKFKAFTVTAGGTVMGKKKRLDVLVRGFADFVAAEQLSATEAQLLLIGDGDEYNALVQQVQDLGIESHVRFAGPRDKQWIAKNLPRCHVFCLPSTAEGMSNAALEAMACGLPLILSDVGSAQEMVIGNGYILDSETPHRQISKYLAQLMTQPAERIQCGAKSRKLSDDSSWSVSSQKFKEIIMGYGQ